MSIIGAFFVIAFILPAIGIMFNFGNFMVAVIVTALLFKILKII